MAIYKDVEPLEVVMYKSKGKEFDEGVNFILEKLDALPVADVIPVVRCKDCKHFITDTFKRTMCNRTFTMFEMQPEDYCSYRERKVENG